MARALLASVAAVALLAASAEAAVLTTYSEISVEFGFNVQQKWSGAGSTIFAYTDPGTYSSPSCVAPHTYTDPSYFASSLCTDGVAALQHRAEVSWGSPVAVGNEERESGTIGFVSFDTATNIMQLQHGVCLKVFPDGSNNLVFYILDGAPPSGDDEWDACDNANWPASINGPTAQATCDVSSGVKYVDRYPTTSTVCPSPGTCDSDIDCVAPSPCAVAMCDTGSNTCTVTNNPDGSFCSDTGLCLSGECFDYTESSARPSWLTGSFTGEVTSTVTVDDAGTPTCLPSPGMPVTQDNTQVGDAWTARTLLFCDHTEGDITRPAFYATPVVSTPVDGMAGRLYPAYMEANGVAVKYDDSSELLTVADCPDGAPKCTISCLKIAPITGMAGISYGVMGFTLAPGSEFDTCDASNYPDPSNVASFTASCDAADHALWAILVPDTGVAACGANGGGGGGSDPEECSIGADIYNWNGLIVTTNKDHCDDDKFDCTPMVLHNGQAGWALGFGRDLTDVSESGVSECSSCATEACMAEMP